MNEIMMYQKDGCFAEMPLPWRYDPKTRNVLAVDGAIVCRVGDSVYGDPRIGEAIVCVFNRQFAIMDSDGKETFGINCNACGCEVDENADFCPACFKTLG